GARASTPRPLRNPRNARSHPFASRSRRARFRQSAAGSARRWKWSLSIRARRRFCSRSRPPKRNANQSAQSLRSEDRPRVAFRAAARASHDGRRPVRLLPRGGRRVAAPEGARRGPRAETRRGKGPGAARQGGRLRRAGARRALCRSDRGFLLERGRASALAPEARAQASLPGPGAGTRLMEPFRLDGERLWILDQTLLPREERWIEIAD